MSRKEMSSFSRNFHVALILFLPSYCPQSRFPRVASIRDRLKKGENMHQEVKDNVDRYQFLKIFPRDDNSVSIKSLSG